MQQVGLRARGPVRLLARAPVGPLARVSVGGFGCPIKSQKRLSKLQSIRSIQRAAIPGGEPFPWTGGLYGRNPLLVV